MNKKSKKIHHALIADSKNILLRPASRVLAGIIKEKEAAFYAAWMHFQTAEDDSDALHQMRIELRRLRVWLKLTRSDVKTNQSTCKRLKTLTNASNPLRDHEVILAWLSRAQTQIEDMPALGILIEYGKQTYQQSAKLSFSKKNGLEPQAKHKKGIGLGIWLEKTVEQRVKQIEQLLLSEMDDIHLARIEIKYLRYLLEPFTNTSDNAENLAKWCKEIQDVLGNFHDVQIFRSHLAEFAGWVIDRELTQIAMLPGKQSKAITKAFANAREPVIALSGWQDQQLTSQWQNWLKVRDNYLYILQELRKH